MTAEPLALLEAWIDLSRKSEEAHYRVASRLSTYASALSVAVITLTTVVGSALFAQLGTKNEWLFYVLATVSVIAAFLAFLEKAFNLSEVAERHRQAGARWHALLMQATLLHSQHSATHPPCLPDLSDLSQTMSEIVEKSPQIPQSWFERVSLSETYRQVSSVGRPGSPSGSGLIVRSPSRTRIMATCATSVVVTVAAYLTISFVISRQLNPTAVLVALLLATIVTLGTLVSLLMKRSRL